MVVLTSVGQFAYGQLTTDADFKRQVYDNDFTVGVLLHTRGFGITGRYGFLTSGFTKNALEMDIVNMRHPKENKTYTDFLNNSTGYVYGRENAFYIIRTGFYRERILYDKTDQGTLSVSFFYSIGVSWGMIKPIYLEIDRQENPTTTIERYDPNSNEGFILGQANFFHRIGETRIQPGLYFKTGFSFDNHESDDRIRSLEAGVIIDAFHKEIPIMHDTSNSFLFFQMYMAINFGKKWN
ncbi:MAG: hypothetical protein JJU02_01645 [Cryomorphaceae bacterium]|nr:hypothetical protein [Cryomorphaceae bacterium]